MEQTELKLEIMDEVPHTKSSVIDVSEDKIIDVIQNILSDEDGHHIILQKDDLMFHIIKFLRCDVTMANFVFQKMDELGLGICCHWDLGYSIRRFANMRGYITDSELEKLDEELLEKARKENQQEAKFMEKYGVDRTQWSDDVLDEYEYED